MDTSFSSKDSSDSSTSAYKEGVDFYLNEDYEKALEIFKDLSENNSEDIRLQLNRTVSEFAFKGHLNYHEFYEKLLSIIKLLTGTENEISIDAVAVKSPVLVYNIAIVYFHLKSYRKALDIMEILCNHFYNEMDKFGKNVKLLKIDLLIKLQMFDQAISEIQKFESQLKAQATDETVNYDQKYEKAIRCRLHQYKIYYYLSMKSIKTAQQEEAEFTSKNDSALQSLTDKCLKAQMKYLKGNVDEANEDTNDIIASSPPSGEQSNSQADFVAFVSKNNQGCCNFYLGKVTFSSTLFQQASTHYERMMSIRKNLSLYGTIECERLSQLVYNFGISLLHQNLPQEAFKYLTSCLKVYYSNPRLWLRVAECCILIQKPDDNRSYLNWTTDKHSLIHEIKGRGRFRKLVFVKNRKHALTQGVQEDDRGKTKYCMEVKPGQDFEPTLDFAMECLENAHNLITQYYQSNSKDFLLVKPSSPIVLSAEIAYLHAAILASSAYCALCIENYPLVIRKSFELLNLEGVPGAFRYLGQMYLAEAYYKNGDLKSCISIMAKLSVPDLRYFLEPEDDSSFSFNDAFQSYKNKIRPIIEWYPQDTYIVQSALVYNKAVALATNGSYQEASELIEMWINRTTKRNEALAPEYLMLAVYLHMRMGNSAKAKTLLTNNSI